jgi:transcriptional regulator with XRE-family HTH domain
MLGDRIATLRREANFSQRELASRLHVSPSAVGMYEQGRREPSIYILAAIAKELHVTLDHLVPGSS